MSALDVSDLIVHAKLVCEGVRVSALSHDTGKFYQSSR